MHHNDIDSLINNIYIKSELKAVNLIFNEVKYRFDSESNLCKHFVIMYLNIIYHIGKTDNIYDTRIYIDLINYLCIKSSKNYDNTATRLLCYYSMLVVEDYNSPR